MIVARTGAVAALLPDGRVLIAGGLAAYLPLMRFLRSAEVFDPATGEFTELAGKMTTKRSDAVAATLPGGRVLIAGGATDGTRRWSGGRRPVLLSSAEVFEPASGAFIARSGEMTAKRGGAVAAPLPGGRVLIAGGGDGSGQVSSAEVFDPASGRFTVLSASLTTARTNPVAAPLPGARVLIAGGQTAGGPTRWGRHRTVALASAEVFEPASEVAGGAFVDQSAGWPAVETDDRG